MIFFVQPKLFFNPAIKLTPSLATFMSPPSDNPIQSAGFVPVRQARAAESKSNQLQDLLDSWKNYEASK